jgi:ABC-type uncharacterized transport system substrate-binding protein
MRLKTFFHYSTIPIARILWLLSSMLFAPCLPAWAQQPQKVFRIGYLSSRDPATESARSEAIRLALREIGYIEGQNLAIVYRYGDSLRAKENAAELVGLKLDLIVVAAGYGVIQVVKDATKTIPIVLVGEGLDPVKGGIVESLGRPGGNITGITNVSRALGGKRLELLKEAVPKLVRVAVLYNPSIPGTTREVKEELPAAAQALKLNVQLWEARTPDDFERVFVAVPKARPDGLYVPGGGTLVNTNLKLIATLALKGRLPSVYQSREAADAGGLMSYGADLADNYRRVAYFVDRILRGAKPADLPIEQPTKFELVINLKTAKQIGVTIPQKVLARADRVIK